MTGGLRSHLGGVRFFFGEGVGRDFGVDVIVDVAAVVVRGRVRVDFWRVRGVEGLAGRFALFGPGDDFVVVEMHVHSERVVDVVGSAFPQEGAVFPQGVDFVL